MTGVPIDRGWAWFVCLGAAVNLFFVTGGLRSVGLLFIEMMEKFEASPTMTAITVGFMGAGFGILSPIGNALGMKFTMRKVVFVGGTVAALSSILTAFSPNIYYIIIVYGVFTGIGYGLMFGPSFVMIGLYFNKRRSLANGLAAAGGSLGQLIAPQLITLLIKQYAFSGCMFIMGAFTFNALPATMLFRPHTAYRTSANQDSRTQSTESKQEISSSKSKAISISELKANQRNRPIITVYNETEAVENPSDANNEKQQLEPLVWKSRSETELDGAIIGSNKTSKNLSHRSLNIISNLSKSHSSLHASVHSLAAFQEVADVDKQYYEDKAMDRTQKAAVKSKGLLSLFDLSLFKNALFIIYVVGLSCGHAGYVNLCMFLPAFANEQGISKTRVAFMLSLIGFSDLFGRVLGGWFADLGLIKRSNIMAICLSFTGTCAILVPFVPIFPVLIGLCTIIGLIGGVYVSLMSVVAIDFLGLERLASTFGLAMMFLGFCSIPVPIIIGLIKDMTGTFSPAVRFCGALMTIGGISFSLEPVARKIESRKRQ